METSFLSLSSVLQRRKRNNEYAVGTYVRSIREAADDAEDFRRLSPAPPDILRDSQEQCRPLFDFLHSEFYLESTPLSVRELNNVIDFVVSVVLIVNTSLSSCKYTIKLQIIDGFVCPQRVKRKDSIDYRFFYPVTDNELF
jgi:hypothetical protein